MICCRQCKRGFTLVELLVVIAIIGVLVALLLPAVQAAREAARRSQCQNNMKQIGLALQNHHDVLKKLPSGNMHCPGPQRWGWIPRILPYIEMQTISDNFDFTQHSWQGNNFQYLKMKHEQFLCPSDPTQDQVLEEEGFAAPTWTVSQADYAACIGDHKNSTGVGHGPDYGNTTCTAPVVRGVMSRWTWSARFGEITDGLSKTFFVGECIGALCITQNWGVQSWATTAHPINYMNKSLMDNKPTQSNPRWDESIGFRSMHPGGAQFLMGDGSVHFLSENIDGPTYRGLASRAGGEVANVP